ncbi:MAG TPA: radical SAM protein [Streptosporangiaceae bacterium]|nr:radical SAM protein [Streptosporangiaceae bacterium]
MHLVELISRRHVAGAGIFAALTRRCPLGCRHCSTNSGNDSEEYDGSIFRRFVHSFTQDCHPEYLLLTGGEPLLRPRLVAELARSAAAAGTSSYLLTGMFFARAGTIPGPVFRAITAVDHVAVSIDGFHAEFVPRDRVFRAMHLMAAEGVDLSVQITGSGDDDPELADNVAAVRAEFGDRVPILAGLVRPYGRARLLPRLSQQPSADLGGPCSFASWPVIGPDGTITACCNQAAVDGVAGPGGGRPGHLALGHAAHDDWPAVLDRCRTAPLLKAVRVLGPHVTARLAGAAEDTAGYCQACWRLAESPEAGRWAASAAGRSVIELMEPQVAASGGHQGPAGFVRRQGSARFAGLVSLGAEGR